MALHSRRDVLKGAAAVAAVAAFPRRASAQGNVMQARPRIDSVLKQAVDAGDVPAGVAMAATDKGVLYEGPFGPRPLHEGPPTPPHPVLLIASTHKAPAP